MLENLFASMSAPCSVKANGSVGENFSFRRWLQTVITHWRGVVLAGASKSQLYRLPTTRSEPETVLGAYQESEGPQFSHHPGSPCSQESQDAFGPIEMCLWVSDQVRNPH